MTLTVVLGGSGSDKNELADQLAADHGLPVDHLSFPAPVGAAAGAVGLRMRTTDLVARIEQHRETTLVVDDLERLIADVLAADGPAGSGVEAAIAALSHREAPTLVVADRFDDHAARDDRPPGRLDILASAIQRLTASADRVLLAVAGRAVEVPPVRPGPSAASAALRDQTDVVVAHGAEDFANLVVDEGAPEWLQRLLRDALEHDIRRYPDERDAIEAIAARHARSPREIVLTNGAVDACWLLAATLQPRRAVCVGPTFVEPEVALGAFGHHVERATRERAAGFALDPALIPAEADHVTIGNPNNPTGTLDPAGAVRALARRGRVLVVDEAFMELVPGERESVAGEQLPGVVVLRSITKLLAIPGLRAGYLIAPRTSPTGSASDAPSGPSTACRWQPWLPGTGGQAREKRSRDASVAGDATSSSGSRTSKASPPTRPARTSSSPRCPTARPRSRASPKWVSQSGQQAPSQVLARTTFASPFAHSS